MNQGGSVRILDATNCTGELGSSSSEESEHEPKLGILFIESTCKENVKTLSLMAVAGETTVQTWKVDPGIEVIMGSKLSGPDYKNKNPVIYLEDFKGRVEPYLLA